MLNVYILAFDPSGSFYEGKGTTGWCLMRYGKVLEYGLIQAKDYKEPMRYYEAHIDLIKEMNSKYAGELQIVMEDYLLYAQRAKDQINSRMETCKLIGIIQYHCYLQKLVCAIQTAAQVKKRWSDEVLLHEGVALPETHEERHARDAIRHAMHYTYFGKGE